MCHCQSVCVGGGGGVQKVSKLAVPVCHSHSVLGGGLGEGSEG